MAQNDTWYDVTTKALSKRHHQHQINLDYYLREQHSRSRLVYVNLMHLSTNALQSTIENTHNIIQKEHRKLWAPGFTKTRDLLARPTPTPFLLRLPTINTHKLPIRTHPYRPPHRKKKKRQGPSITAHLHNAQREHTKHTAAAGSAHHRGVGRKAPPTQGYKA